MINYYIKLILNWGGMIDLIWLGFMTYQQYQIFFYTNIKYMICKHIL